MSKINMGTSAVGRWMFPLSLSGSWGATWYGIWAPSSSNLEVGNQVHQDDPVNEAVRDAFGVQDDNFTEEVRGPHLVFFRTMQREFFSLMDESDRPLYQGCRNTQSYLFLSNCTISSACVGSPIRQCRCSRNYFEMLSQTRTFPHPSTRRRR
ncbi:hypothetical protein K1719_019382 [Acacia pycnantha]|nr:hypothetical protein K1719_019382 [Acacia pycnantha]